MRSCDEITELLSAALDGALTGEEQAVLDEHLADCPACSALFADLRSLQAAAGELEEVPAPAGFAARVMDAVAADPTQEGPAKVIPFPQRRKKNRAAIPWKGWTATAAVVGVVLLGASLLPRGGNTSAEMMDNALIRQQSACSTTADSANGENFSASDSVANGMPILASEEMAETQQEAPGALSGELDGSAGTSMEQATCCGTIILTGESLPEVLNAYEADVDDRGRRTYLVSAEDFFSCLEALKMAEDIPFTYESADPGAAFGWVIVEASAAP